MRTVDEIKDERRQLLRGNRFLRDDCHRAVDEMLAKTAATVKERLPAREDRDPTGPLCTARTRLSGFARSTSR